MASPSSTVQQGTTLANGYFVDAEGNLRDQYGNAVTDVNNATAQAVPSITNNFTGITGDPNNALAQAHAAETDATNWIQQMLYSGQSALQEGTDTAAQYEKKAALPWVPLYKSGQSAIDQAQALLGLSGNPEDMYATLEQIPGYQFSVDQATQAVDRNNAATGNLNSGKTQTDLATYVNGLASQNYFDYLNSLNPLISLATPAASGVSSAYNALGGLYSNLGSNSASLYQNAGNQLANTIGNYGNQAANILMGQGTNLSNIYTGQGQQLAGIDTGLGDQLANVNSAQANLAYQSGVDQASLDQANTNNMWNMALGLTKAGTSLLGSPATSVFGSMVA